MVTLASTPSGPGQTLPLPAPTQTSQLTAVVLADPGVRVRFWRTYVDHPAWQARPNVAHQALARLDESGVACGADENIDGNAPARRTGRPQGAGASRHHVDHHLHSAPHHATDAAGTGPGRRRGTRPALHRLPRHPQARHCPVRGEPQPRQGRAGRRDRLQHPAAAGRRLLPARRAGRTAVPGSRSNAARAWSSSTATPLRTTIWPPR